MPASFITVVLRRGKLHTMLPQGAVQIQQIIYKYTEMLNLVSKSAHYITLWNPILILPSDFVKKINE